MVYENRRVLYQKIEEIRQRPLIVYVTGSRGNASAQMSSDAIPQFIKQLQAIDNNAESIDVLIVSNGGDPIVSWRIVSMIRERFSKFAVLLPYAAYSAATLLALGADEIVMHPFANLGPVDPQLMYKRRIPGNAGSESHETIHFGSEDLSNFIDFVRHDVGISDQEQLQRAFEMVCNEVGAIPIGVAKRSSQLALSMGEKLLSLHLDDHGKAKAIAEALNRSFFHHGYPLSVTEAQNIGLPVKRAEDEISDRIWQVWEDLEEDMQINQPFNPIEIVLNDPRLSALHAPVPQIDIPANLPPQAMQQILQQVLSQIRVFNNPPVDYDLFQATIESKVSRSEFHTVGKITATRLPDMNIAVNTIQISSGWRFVDGSEGSTE